MAKPPAFMFYVRDWLTDSELQKCSLSVRGMWIDMLCHMWLNAPYDTPLDPPQHTPHDTPYDTPQQGVLIGGIKALSSSLHMHHNSLRKFIREAAEHPFCDITFNSKTGVYAIVNRRMARESTKRRAHAESQQRYRDRQKDTPGDESVITPLAYAPALAIASAPHDESPEEIPDGPAGWIAAACTLTGRSILDRNRELVKGLAKKLYEDYGDTANDVLSRIRTGPPIIRYPRRLLEDAVDSQAPKSHTGKGWVQ